MNLILTIVIVILVCSLTKIYAANGEGASRDLLPDISDQMKTASQPPKFFYTPTARVLKSMEVGLFGGSTFGGYEAGGFARRISLGLGGVGEIEMSSAHITNQLTGQGERLPARTFKIHLVPDQFRHYRYMPDIALALKTTSWGTNARKGRALSKTLELSFAAENQGYGLTGLALQSRFTSLHFIVGTTGSLGAIYSGVSLTDVRTRGGGQWIYNKTTDTVDHYEIPEQQKNLIRPFGGITLNANESTQIIGEVSTVPNLEYNVEARRIDISDTWIGIGGLRFFMWEWISLDVGVRYLSTFEGIADTDINLGVNFVVPLQHEGS
ncbi:MAG: hypothetical protein K9N46_09480 [Candidatus Marinimicrobia bacterium]|nr:hypothetical protein [Candidatus Neomarinimicrobiota bacterium]MCF7828451.1 hypothetical protein [Candidatus Neomarinimicrobiota bacterium]MCF7880955.1 hypothetical protein [Candidatus Neomarinimicrobiota bacterium]